MSGLGCTSTNTSTTMNSQGGESAFRVALDGTFLARGGTQSLQKTAQQGQTDPLDPPSLPQKQILFDQIHPDALPQIKEIFAMLQHRPDELFGAVYRKVLPGGRWQWVDAKFFASMKVGSSVVDEVFVVEKDVSADLERISRITEDSAKFKDLVENQEDVFYNLDLEGNFTTVAYSAYGQWGFKPEELVGRNCWGMLREMDRITVAALVSDMIAQRTLLRPFVVERLCKNNSYCKEEIRLNCKIDPVTRLPISLSGISRKVGRHIPSSPPPEVATELPSTLPALVTGTGDHQQRSAFRSAPPQQQQQQPHPQLSFITQGYPFAFPMMQQYPVPQFPSPTLLYPPPYSQHMPSPLPPPASAATVTPSHHSQQTHFQIISPSPQQPAKRRKTSSSHGEPTSQPSPEEISALSVLSVLSAHNTNHPRTQANGHRHHNGRDGEAGDKGPASTGLHTAEDGDEDEEGHKDGINEWHGKRAGGRRRRGEEDADYEPKRKSSKPNTSPSGQAKAKPQKPVVMVPLTSSLTSNPPTPVAAPGGQKFEEAMISVKRTEKESPLKRPCIGAGCGVWLSLEWRKGPDGVKSLCNACGLRYNRGLRNGRKSPDKTQHRTSSPSTQS